MGGPPQSTHTAATTPRSSSLTHPSTYPPSVPHPLFECAGQSCSDHQAHAMSIALTFIHVLAIKLKDALLMRRMRSYHNSLIRAYRRDCAKAHRIAAKG